MPGHQSEIQLRPRLVTSGTLQQKIEHVTTKRVQKISGSVNIKMVTGKHPDLARS
jgi:archaellin